MFFILQEVKVVGPDVIAIIPEHPYGNAILKVEKRDEGTSPTWRGELSNCYNRGHWGGLLNNEQKDKRSVATEA